MKNKFLCLLIVLLISNVSCNRLNQIRSDGYVSYNGNAEPCVYFETKDDVEPFIHLLNSNFGRYNSVDSTSMGINLNWNRIKIGELSTSPLNMQVSILKEFIIKDSKAVYDITSVLIILMDEKGRNLIDSKNGDFFKSRIQKLIDASLN